MRHLPYIILFVLMTFLGSSCQDVSVLSEQEIPSVSCRQSTHLHKDTNKILYREGTLSTPISLYRTVFHPEERAETNTGERTAPTFRGGGKAFTACRAPRSTIHQSLGGFVQRTTVPIRSFASHTYLFYVLRHIIR
ncbi:MAG: hypothetical protein IJP75_08455 [Bacteroidaceae bacterium]|nr:hypothetical protein [Bacteroidaceae bacterium]